MIKTSLVICLTVVSITIAAVIESHGRKVDLGHRYRRNVPQLNDPNYANAFYLNDNFGVTMNIIKAWNKGYTGKNVTICISDPTGVEWRHDEHRTKFVQEGSYDYENNDTDPSPNTQSNHGTAMAGLAVGKANNAKCSVGVAYDAGLSAIKFAATGPTEFYGIHGSFSFKNKIKDVLSCSWGPISLFQSTMGYMSPHIAAAVKQAGEQGRNGKGTIIVFSVGNGGQFNGSCSYDEYISSIHTLGISVVTGKNVPSTQNIHCAGISAVAYSRDGRLGINNPDDLMPTADVNNGCARSSGSSSGAAAVSSGIMALVLQANPNLGWRDVQHLVARSSSSNFNSVQWKTNKAGIKVSDGFGFGLLDADALVDNAKTWNNVGTQLECKVDSTSQDPLHGVNTLTKTVDTTTWPSSCGGASNKINYLEHVVLVLSLNFTKRKLIEIEVQSPGGTKSLILRSGRRYDIGQEIKDLSTLSLQFWGESAVGVWTIKVRNTIPNISQMGDLYKWSLKLFGTSANPLASNVVRASTIKADSNSVSTTSGSTVTAAASMAAASTNTAKLLPSAGPTRTGPKATNPKGSAKNICAPAFTTMAMLLVFIYLHML